MANGQDVRSTSAATVEPLPPGEFADKEVSTNVAFAADRATMTRVEITVALEATLTSNVEVAIGADANGNGTHNFGQRLNVLTNRAARVE